MTKMARWLKTIRAKSAGSFQRFQFTVQVVSDICALDCKDMEMAPIRDIGIVTAASPKDSANWRFTHEAC
jgi:hypothetical protein